MTESVYIHIPFCKSKCHYCSFVSFCAPESKNKYLTCLHREIDFFYENERLKTIYIGGGTPSLLEVSEINDLIKKFYTDDNAEITMELNPEDVNYDYLRNLHDIGVNRLSFGCQTFNDDILKMINRRHNSQQVLKAVETASKAGFENISLDFIYGLPSQTCKGFIEDLKKAAEMNLAHISLYGLKLEEGCYFYTYPPENLPDDDMQAEMYYQSVALLTNYDYIQYEVSNFSKQGNYSRHNMNYWNNGEYYGFGISAHGYKNGIRYENPNNLKEYINNPLAKKNSRILTKQEKLEEEIFLGFRKLSGIDVALIRRKYGIDFEYKYHKILDKYMKLNLLKKTETGYKLTLQGIMVSNVILADFIE